METNISREAIDGAVEERHRPANKETVTKKKPLWMGTSGQVVCHCKGKQFPSSEHPNGLLQNSLQKSTFMNERK